MVASVLKSEMFVEGLCWMFCPLVILTSFFPSPAFFVMSDLFKPRTEMFDLDHWCYCCRHMSKILTSLLVFLPISFFPPLLCCCRCYCLCNVFLTCCCCCCFCNLFLTCCCCHSSIQLKWSETQAVILSRTESDVPWGGLCCTVIYCMKTHDKVLICQNNSLHIKIRMWWPWLVKAKEKTDSFRPIVCCCISIFVLLYYFVFYCLPLSIVLLVPI